MKLVLSKKPKDVDFVKNNPFFRILLNRDIYSTPCIDIFIFKAASSVPHPLSSGKILFTLPNNEEVEFEAIYGTDVDKALEADTFRYYSTLEDCKNEFISKFQNHYVLSEYYDIDIFIDENSGWLILKFTCKDITNETPLDFTFSGYSGSAPTEIHTPAYLLEFPELWYLFAKYKISRYNDKGLIEVVDTPKMFFTHKNWNVDVYMTVIERYFKYIDIPIFPDFYGAQLMRYNHIDVEFLYAEAYGTPLKVEWVQKYGPIKILNCKLQSQYYDDNKVDFVLPSNQSDSLNSINTVIGWGSNSGEKVRTFEGMPQYIYLNTMYCSDTKSINCIVYYITAQGTVGTISKQSLALLQGNIYRFSTDLYALGLDNKDIVQYTVSLTCNASPVFSRIYQVISKPFFARTFLFQNKYGLLESFFVENLEEEKTVEGRKVLLNKLNEIDIQNKGTYYTARTGFKRKNELQALKYAFENKHNFIISNDKIIRISILPDSFTIVDEDEDLQNLEFKFCVSLEAEELPIKKFTDEMQAPDLGYIIDDIVMCQDGIYNSLYGHVSENLTVWEDLTLNGNNLNTLSGTAFEILEKAIKLTPDLGNVGIPAGPIRYNGTVVETFDELTIEICFRLDELEQTNKMLADFSNYTDDVFWSLYTESLTIYDGDKYTYINFENFVENQIITISFVYANGDVNIYVNGVLFDTVSGIDPLFKKILKEGLTIANSSWGNDGFKGLIHNWRIYFVALDWEEIVDNYANDLTRFTDDSGSGSASASASASSSASASASSSASASGSGQILPIAEFSATPLSGSKPLHVVFINLSQNAASYFWDFGDGETSTEDHPVHDYQEEGLYTVELMATNDDGADSEKKTDYIEVL